MCIEISSFTIQALFQQVVDVGFKASGQEDAGGSRFWDVAMEMSPTATENCMEFWMRKAIPPPL